MCAGRIQIHTIKLWNPITTTGLEIFEIFSGFSISIFIFHFFCHLKLNNWSISYGYVWCKPNGEGSIKQQTLKAWEPLLTPVNIIGVLLVTGLLFLPIGVVVIDYSKQVSFFLSLAFFCFMFFISSHWRKWHDDVIFEICVFLMSMTIFCCCCCCVVCSYEKVITHTERYDNVAGCSGVTAASTMAELPKICSVSFVAQKDFPPPIYFYYNLKGFYQVFLLLVFCMLLRVKKKKKKRKYQQYEWKQNPNIWK